jgi:signal-transduction protein with cAMP-binding, CBS, and nucleotidyltransferase domain
MNDDAGDNILGDTVQAALNSASAHNKRAAQLFGQAMDLRQQANAHTAVANGLVRKVLDRAEENGGALEDDPTLGGEAAPADAAPLIH